MRLPRRRTFWLSIAVLLVIVNSGVWFVVPRSRITQENFDRIEDGMNYDQVVAILGPAAQTQTFFFPADNSGLKIVTRCVWHEGPNGILVSLAPELVAGKQLWLATAWETVRWCARRGAEKIGVKWN